MNHSTLPLTCSCVVNNTLTHTQRCSRAKQRRARQQQQQQQQQLQRSPRCNAQSSASRLQRERPRCAHGRADHTHTHTHRATARLRKQRPATSAWHSVCGKWHTPQPRNAVTLLAASLLHRHTRRMSVPSTMPCTRPTCMPAHSGAAVRMLQQLPVSALTHMRCGQHAHLHARMPGRWLYTVQGHRRVCALPMGCCCSVPGERQRAPVAVQRTCRKPASLADKATVLTGQRPRAPAGSPRAPTAQTTAARSAGALLLPLRSWRGPPPAGS
jgi:hypothetical protein